MNIPVEAQCDVDELLARLSLTEGASDLLITVGKPPQLRIYNEIESLGYPPLMPADSKRLCMSVLNEEQAERFQADKEIDISISRSGSGRYRVNIYQQRGSLAMVVRVVSMNIPSFESHGRPDIVRDLAELRRGLVLLTGPTGTGKTTTVAALIDHINRTRSCHVICIEDPIEYVHAHKKATVDQREIGPDTISFGAALRTVLRQSPDVIVVGEIRDADSAQAAITLAETGHLTLATLHTRGAVASVNRLVDIFPSEQSSQVRAQLADSLAAVLWQQLLPRKDQDGLVLACEVMVVIPAIRALVRQGRTHEIQSLIQSGRKHGMTTMEQSVDDLVEKGLVERQ